MVPAIEDECALILRIFVQNGGRTMPLRSDFLRVFPDVLEDRLFEAVDGLHVTPGRHTIVGVQKGLSSIASLA